ncbi:hypothetical protein [Geopseudomonas aromaticivorans]
MQLHRLHSTCYTRNPAAKPLRQPDAGVGCAHVTTWYTEVRTDTSALSPFAAWMARNVRSTLHADTVLRLFYRAAASEVIDWQFTQYDPIETTPADYWEAEARRILECDPARVQVVTEGVRVEWTPSQN